MTHDFSTLTSVLGRCSAKVADQVIAEIRSAINAAEHDNNNPSADLAEVSIAVHKKKQEQAAVRRAKKAARKAAAPAEQIESPQCAEAPNARGGSCGEAEAELPATYFTPEMVKYLRRCREQYMLSVLNSYVHLLFTGNVVDTADDHRYLDNFITLTRTVGLIDNVQPPTPAQAANFLFDNPALPLPRAERRRLQRMLRKQKRVNVKNQLKFASFRRLCSDS